VRRNGEIGVDWVAPNYAIGGKGMRRGRTEEEQMEKKTGEPTDVHRGESKYGTRVGGRRRRPNRL
jgi:hypothetical protein